MKQLLVAFEDSAHALFVARCHNERVYVLRAILALTELFARGALPASVYATVRNKAAARSGSGGRGWKEDKARGKK